MQRKINTIPVFILVGLTLIILQSKPVNAGLYTPKFMYMPFLGGLTEDSVTFYFAIEPDCTVYYMVLEHDGLKPNVFNMLYGYTPDADSLATAGNMFATSHLFHSLTINDLAPSTSYDAYFMARDYNRFQFSEIVSLINITTSPGTANSVPEPTTFFLFGFGLLGLIRLRR